MHSILAILTAALGPLTPSVLRYEREAQSPRPCPIEASASREYFYVGGQYIATSVGEADKGHYMEGQIYVERLTPPVVKHKHPLVFIHGSAQTGAVGPCRSLDLMQRLLTSAQNWLNTPDNRQGWASYFLEQGYTVYLSDQPQRGRSPWLPSSGDLAVLSTSAETAFFTAPETVAPLPYPQADLHTQWPGTGLLGDPTFDAFYASQVPFQSDPMIFSRQNNHSYVSLLDRIGEPVVLITHSQAGLFGWQIGDARPELVAGIVALDPGTTPFETHTGRPFAPGYLPDFGNLSYGVTFLPITYDPPLPNNDPSALHRQAIAAPSADRTPCILQAEPARQLTNLAQTPVLQVVGEASFHAPFSYCVAEYLEQAGVAVDFVELGQAGIHGNGHFCFMELNNLVIAEEVIMPWLRKMENRV